MNYRFTMFFILIWCLNGFSQIKQDFIFGEVRNSTDGQSIADVNVVFKDSTAIFTTLTDANGKFKFPKTTLSKKAKLEISCIGFETKNFNPSTQKVFYLNEKTEVLNTVLIKKETKKMSIIESFLPYVHNLGFSRIAVNYIPYIEKRKNVETVKFHLVDFGGVKGLKYLPFKVNFFTVNNENGKPDKKILMEDILIKKSNNKKWVEVDFSNFNINVPPEGIFVAFIILDRKDYIVETIESKYGIIDAVPYLKLRRTNKKNEKSYVLHPFYYEPAKENNYWERLPAVFEIEIEYEK